MDKRFHNPFHRDLADTVLMCKHLDSTSSLKKNYKQKFLTLLVFIKFASAFHGQSKVFHDQGHLGLGGTEMNDISLVPGTVREMRNP